KFGGVPYPIQRGAAAVYSPEGRSQVKQQIDDYLRNASGLKKGLLQLGYKVFGGVDAPYLWVKAPKKLSSWEFFDLLLLKAQVISVPGSGFGMHGEGFVRLSAFPDPNRLSEALARIGSICL